MGCDIHAHIEVEIDGKWEHYSQLNIPRDYELFAKIAGVRGGVKPIVTPRGLPEDMNFVTRYDWEENWKEDGHTCGWLTGTEADMVEKWFEEQNGFQHPSRPWGYVFGNGLNHFDSPEDAKRKPRLTNIRVVFWFDN